MATTAAPAAQPAFWQRLARHAGLELVTLAPQAGEDGEPTRVNPLAALLIGEEASRRRRMLGIAYAGGTLTVAATGEFEAVAREAAALTGRRIRVVVTPPRELDAALDAAFGPAVATLPMDAPLGALLVERGLVEPGDVEAALTDQRRAGGRLGELLVGRGVLEPDDLVAVLAAQFGVPVAAADLVPEPRAVALVAPATARALRVVPVAAAHGKIDVVAADRLDAAARAELAAQTGLEPRLRLASPAAVEALLLVTQRVAMASAAREDLRTRFPEESASRVVSDPQRIALAAVGVVLLAGLIAGPRTTVVVLVAVAVALYLAVLGHRCGLAWRALGARREIVVTADELAALDEAALPRYTVLVPLFREAAVVPRLVAGLAELDYPRHKHEVLLLCEADDEETASALRELRLPAHMRVVTVPDGQPRTKPKACNFGLQLATGDRIVIFDAEDRPEADQLKKAVVAFERSAARTACVQAKLAHFNAEQNLLTRWFASEFATWFELLLPGLDASGAPIPLGGTSNHFRADRLRELAAWDPFNVTEDADLGIRLHKAGLRTATFDSTTFEEANSDLVNWVRQRSRWSKGYMQTWLVHMRHPVRLAQRLGLRGFLSFQLMLGGIVVPLLNPVFWALTTAFFLAAPGAVRDVFPHVVFVGAAIALVVGNFALVLLAVAGVLRQERFGLVRFALFTPLYWGLISLAAWKGFLQLFFRPFYWEKTVHGLDGGTAG